MPSLRPPPPGAPMGEPNPDYDRAVAMLRALRKVKPEQRIDTLALVCRAYLDATPTAGRWRHTGLTDFFGEVARV